MVRDQTSRLLSEPLLPRERLPTVPSAGSSFARTKRCLYFPRNAITPRVQTIRLYRGMQHWKRVKRPLRCRKTRLEYPFVEGELNVATHGRRYVGVVVDHDRLAAVGDGHIAARFGFCRCVKPERAHQGDSKGSFGSPLTVPRTLSR